jgi:hypothetical protein
MNTYPHRQQDATPQKPFYSVCYQYIRNPWTLWSCNHYKGHFKGTQSGTSSFEVAKALAERLAKQIRVHNLDSWDLQEICAPWAE